MKQIVMAMLVFGIASCAVENAPTASPAPVDDEDTSTASEELGDALPASGCGFFVCIPLARCKASEGGVSHPMPGCNGANTCCDL